MTQEYEDLKKVRSRNGFINFLTKLHDNPNDPEVRMFEVHENIFHRIFFILSKSWHYKWLSGDHVIEIEHQYGTLILIKTQ